VCSASGRDFEETSLSFAVVGAGEGATA